MGESEVLALPRRARSIALSHRSRDRETAFEVVCGGRETDLQACLGQTAPSHAGKAVAALPGAEDFLDATADAMDRLVPSFEAPGRFRLVSAPHAGGGDAWRAALGTLSTLGFLGTLSRWTNDGWGGYDAALDSI